MDLPEIDIDELARRHGEGAAVLDVREDDEYAEGHVPGAQHIPLALLPEQLGQLPADDDDSLLVICRSGGRSAKAVELLLSQGVDATNVAGGTLGWIAAGQPVTTGTDRR